MNRLEKIRKYKERQNIPGECEPILLEELYELGLDLATVRPADSYEPSPS